MMKMERPQQPDWLKQNYKKWGRKFKENKELGLTEFRAKYQNNLVNQLLLPILRNATNKHCAFCDYTITKGTVEHFRPKSKFPLLSYCWFNLFPACNLCQEKNDTFPEKNDILKPDKTDFSFRKYFIYSSFTGTIEVNPIANEEDRKKAQNTIEIYNLNGKELIEARLDVFEEYENVSFEKRPFRFIFTK